MLSPGLSTIKRCKRTSGPKTEEHTEEEVNEVRPSRKIRVKGILLLGEALFSSLAGGRLQKRLHCPLLEAYQHSARGFSFSISHCTTFGSYYYLGGKKN